MNHLMVGALFPFLVAAVLYARRRCRASLTALLVTPAMMVLCATWAVLPDLPRTFGLANYDATVSANPFIDIFFWHYTINQHESASPWYAVVFVLMVLCLFGAAWRELSLLEGD